MVVQLGGSTTTYRLYTSNIGGAYDSGNGASYTPTSTGTAQINIVVYNGATCNNLIFKPMLESGTTAHDYEPYTNGASPNPTYPQDINVVTGTQEVVVQNKNLCDGQFRQGGWHDTSGTTRLFTTQNLVVKQGTTLTISTTLDTTQYKYGIVVGKLPYPQTANPNIYDSGWNTTSSKTITFNVSGYDIGYLGITIATANGTDSLTPSDIEGVEWQVEYGSNATTKVEHQEQTKTLHLGDIELAKIGTYQDRIFESSGKNLFDKDTTKEGYLIQVNGEEVANASYGASDYIPIKANTYYTRTNCNNYYGAFYNTNKEFVGAITNANTILSSVDGYVRISFLLTNTDKVMLNLGSTALPYEPYGSDKWYIEKNIGKYAINGASGTFTKPSTNRFNIDGALTDYLKAINVVTCMSDKYVSYEQKAANSDFNTLVANVNYGIELSSSSSAFTIRIKDTNYDDVNQYKTWLASNNVELLYVLATPTYTEITNTTLIEELNELEKMMSYNGQTNISISGNLPMIIDVTALKGE